MEKVNVGNRFGVIVAILVGLLSATVGYGLSAVLGAEFVIKVFAGGAVGVLCSLIPYYLGRANDPVFAKRAVWVCLGAGMIGGMILAIPAAIALAVITRLRSRNRR